MHFRHISATCAPILLSVLVCGLAACANGDSKTAAPPAANAPTADPTTATKADPFVGWLAPYKHCREDYAEIDARIDAAGVRDAGYYRVPGYPYFRTDRVTASFAREVSGLEQISGWMRRMREFDQEAREFEYINLGMNTQERAQWRYKLLSCGGGLAGIELDDPEAFERLLTAVAPPDEYQPAAPDAAPSASLSANIRQHQDALLRDFAMPLAQLKPDAPLRLWKAEPKEDLALVADGYGPAIADELGVPGLVDSQWRALAELNAPSLWIETAGERDQPGTPGWSADGAVVDPAQPRINYQVTFTRFGGARLMQLNYFIWFKGRNGETPAAGGDDSRIDGLIWRVTLDEKAQPLVYESIHASGRDHLWFPVRVLTPRSDAGERPLIAQNLVPKGPLALRLQAGTHALRRVVALDQIQEKAAPTTYALARYEDLFTLPTPQGARRNLYGPDGLIPGVQQKELAWLWGSRVAKPGALRELGRIPISYAGQSQFDDAFLMEKLFVVTPLGVAKADATKRNPGDRASAAGN